MEQVSMQKRRNIHFRKDMEWMIEYIDRIVQTKTEMGVRTSFSWEMQRLARNGLLNSKEGSSIDRTLLK
tara:strand:+ start:4545 stop:4751 length:207 start_codon:yes stop_codon:yes gene_type:complete